jgi:hypothetical protein
VYSKTALRCGNTASCGCLNSQNTIRRNKLTATHGEYSDGGYSPEIKIYASMQQRCCNPSNKAFHNYGGRGIKVCDRWSGPSGFQNFLEDMGRRPSSDHSLDRIDVNGDYCPENCRWATRMEQANNRRTCKYLEHQGKTQTISQWCRELDLCKSLTRHRLQAGWSVEEALTTPVEPRKYKND